MASILWRVAGCGWHVACGVWQVAGGRRRILADIMTSVDMVVGTLSLVRPPGQDLTMPQGHGVDNCSLRFCRKGRQLDLGESRSPTQFAKRNLQPVSRRFWAYAYAFGPRLMVMMVMVMVLMVPKALSQVGWLRQCQSQSINRLAY
jgi:hypothetical protein